MRMSYTKTIKNFWVMFGFFYGIAQRSVESNDVEWRLWQATMHKTIVGPTIVDTVEMSTIIEGDSAQYHCGVHYCQRNSNEYNYCER